MYCVVQCFRLYLGIYFWDLATFICYFCSLKNSVKSIHQYSTHHSIGKRKIELASLATSEWMKKSSFSTTNPNKSRLWHNILTFFVGGFQRERVPFSVLWRIGIFWKILFNGNNLAISFHWVLSSVVVKCCLKIHIILEFRVPIKIPWIWIKPRSPPWLNHEPLQVCCGSWLNPIL